VTTLSIEGGNSTENKNTRPQVTQQTKSIKTATTDEAAITNETDKPSIVTVRLILIFGWKAITVE
jgi:hypothetical protein